MYTLRGRLIIALTMILSAVVLLSWLRPHPQLAGSIAVPAHALYLFEGVTGPVDVTTVPPARPTAWVQHAKGSSSRLAVLLTDSSSAWLGLAHGLKTIGIPFVMTEDYAEALKHRVVLVYPEISGRRLSPDALRALAAFPRTGGTLIGSQVLGGGLQDLFGFREAIGSRRRFEVRFSENVPLLAR